MKIRWTDQARSDLKEIGRYIAADDPAAARRWVARLKTRAIRAAGAPRAGRMVPEMGREDIREVLERGYRIVYQLRQHGIYVLTVFEGHRELRLPSMI